MNSDKDSRYRGHLNLREIGPDGQKKLGEASVIIIGAGGLGSPVALYLAAAGIGRISVLDPDTVSLSNLQRQIIHSTSDLGRPKTLSAGEKMTAINPEIAIETVQSPLDNENAPSLIAAHDLAIDCTDNLATRLLISDTCVSQKKPYIFGAVRRFGGQVFTHIPGTASYRDIFDDTLAEDDIPCSVTGVLNTVVGIIGTIQATEAVKLLTGAGSLLTDRLLVFDALAMRFDTYSV